VVVGGSVVVVVVGASVVVVTAEPFVVSVGLLGTTLFTGVLRSGSFSHTS